MNQQLSQQLEFQTIQDRATRFVSLDIVVPVHNEELVLDLLFRRLDQVFSISAQAEHRIKSVRYIIVDDGSNDRSAELVSQYIERGSCAVLYRLSRKFGHQCAISAGFANTDADVIGCIDADLQDPPELMIQMLSKWREGFDVVYGIRQKRKESLFKVGAYWLFYRVLSFFSEINIPLDSGDFCLMDRRSVLAMRSLPEKLRYPRVLRAWIGFRQTGIYYERLSRAAGFSKYKLSNLYYLATDGLASASIRPLQISQLFSFIYLALLMILVTFIFCQLGSYLAADDRTPLWFLLLLTFIALGGFVQISCTYILSAYVGRLYLEVKGRPSYLIQEVVGRENVHPNI